MGELAHTGLSVEQFYDWLGTQDRKHELVDGAPVIRARADRRHDRIAVKVVKRHGHQ